VCRTVLFTKFIELVAEFTPHLAALGDVLFKILSFHTSIACRAVDTETSTFKQVRFPSSLPAFEQNLAEFTFGWPLFFFTRLGHRAAVLHMRIEFYTGETVLTMLAWQWPSFTAALVAKMSLHVASKNRFVTLVAVFRHMRADETMARQVHRKLNSEITLACASTRMLFATYFGYEFAFN